MDRGRGKGSGGVHKPHGSQGQWSGRGGEMGRAGKRRGGSGAMPRPPPTRPAAVTVLLCPGRPAGVCPPGPPGPTPPRGSRRSRLRFRSGTGAGRSRRPPSRRRPAGCPCCSGRPRRRGALGAAAVSAKTGRAARWTLLLPPGLPRSPRPAPGALLPSPSATRPDRLSLWTDRRRTRGSDAPAPPNPLPHCLPDGRIPSLRPAHWEGQDRGGEGLAAGLSHGLDAGPSPSLQRVTQQPREAKAPSTTPSTQRRTG